jgi:hypothetical protein
MQRALYRSVRSRPLLDDWGSPGEDSAEHTDSTPERPTNIYYIAQYLYQISIHALPMADHELGLLLPRSGRILFNAKLFGDVPRGRELATRDAWWRVVDASPAIRFLLGWAVSFYRTSRFAGVVHEQLPGWSRMLYFTPLLPDAARESVPLWSDVVCEVTELFAPNSRIQRQLQAVIPEARNASPRAGRGRNRREQGMDAVLRYLADQNNCPVALVRRSLDGNKPISTFDEYVEFTEALLDDIPRLQMQRTVAVRNYFPQSRRDDTCSPPESRPIASDLSFGLSVMPDPRRMETFWQLHL